MLLFRKNFSTMSLNSDLIVVRFWSDHFQAFHLLHQKTSEVRMFTVSKGGFVPGVVSWGSFWDLGPRLIRTMGIVSFPGIIYLVPKTYTEQEGECGIAIRQGQPKRLWEHVEYLMFQRSTLHQGWCFFFHRNWRWFGQQLGSLAISEQIILLSLGNRKPCVLVAETMMSQQTYYDSIKGDEYIPLRDIIPKNSRKRSVVSLKDESYMFLFHLSSPHGWDTRCCLRLSGTQVFFAWMYEVPDFRFQWLWWGQMQKRKWAKKTIPPIHPQFVGHFHAIVPTPWFPPNKKNSKGSPLGMGFPQCVRTSRLDIVAQVLSTATTQPGSVHLVNRIRGNSSVARPVRGTFSVSVRVFFGVLAPGGLGSEGT